MRELRGAGVTNVKHVPGEHNPADLFTKVLSRQPFEKHRRTVLNLAAAEGVARCAHDRLSNSGGPKAPSKKKKIAYKA